MPLPIVFLLMTVTLNSMGIGLIIPVMPDLIQEVTGRPLSEAALFGGVLSTLYAVMQFLFAPFLGRLSDAYGRRAVLLGTLGIMVVDYVVMALASSLWMLLLARAVGGFASATQATASAAMADISDPADRARRFGIVSAAFGMGFVLGPVLGGFLGELGSRAPFWAAGLLCGAGALLGAFVFPETLPKDRRRPVTWKGVNPFAAFRALGRLPGITRALIVYFLYNLAFGVYPAIWSFFTQAQFAWSPAMVGFSLGIFGVSFALVQGGLMGVILRLLGERGTMLFGLGVSVLCYAALSLVTSGTLALIFAPLAAFGAVYAPAQQGVMSRVVGPEEQGALQGVLTSTVAVAMMIAPFLMSNVFATFTAPDRATQIPGAPFAVAGLLTLAALALALWPTRQPAAA
ncbi:Tetracycline resistance protein, class C [Maliponia aquimaris]|uniref:Tetracycline resistance protein, class C n=2 Tax=Maliponia aquimaris TaxID=1673631 RepID=A0A238K537_9RHOB|nr:Tetracycline resistance protein, class C [Maliponia aquimaris]